MSYDTSVDGHLKRCKAGRDKDTVQHLLYAALELRLGVEARLAESVQAVSGLSAAQRRQWKVVHLASTLEANKWSNGDDILVMLYHLKEPDESIELHYFPVSKRLQEIVMRLGAFMHRNERFLTEAEGAHAELRALVKEGFGALSMANSGELLGLPQVDPQTHQLGVILKFPDGDPRAAALKEAFRVGRKYTIDWVTITPVGTPMFYEPTPEDTQNEASAQTKASGTGEGVQQGDPPR
jgi:hypothetical protein